MKILFLISQLPYPPDTGAKIRSFNLIKALAKAHSITLVTYGAREVEMEKIRRLAELPVKITLVPMGNGNPYMLAFRNLFSRYPYSVDKYYSAGMAGEVAKLLESEEFDLIHCDSLQMSRNVLKFKHIPKIMTEHNIESQILERVAYNETNIFKRLYFYIQYLKLRRYEVFACRQFDRMIAVSEEDKRYLARFIPENHISIVPNGVDTEFFSPQPTTHNPPSRKFSLIYTGSMDWQPNDDAMIYFIRDVYPLIKERLSKSEIARNDENSSPQITLTIVGRDPSSALQKLALSDRSIKVTGRVEDVRPYVANSPVFIVPLRIGGGSRLKILEAMAMGKAVVSTSIGCEGLEVTDKKNIIIADKPGDFADAVTFLLRDREYAGRLGKAGRKLVEERYDWKIVSNKLDEAWDGVMSRREVPILLYHDIREDDFDVNSATAELRPYILRKSEFEKQMAWLARNSKNAMIVFDDGWRSNYEIAYPALKRHGLTATFFVTIDNIGKPGMMTWSEIKEMAGNGMSIGSHNMTHRIPVNLPDGELKYEMRESKRILEEKLAGRIESFSSPAGFYDRRMEDFAKEAGYEAVYFSRAEVSLFSKSGGRLLVLNKIGIKRDCDFETFTAIAKGDEGVLGKIRSRQIARDAAKSMLGVRGYNRIRSAVLARRA